MPGLCALVITTSARLAWHVLLELKARGYFIVVAGDGEAGLLRISRLCDRFVKCGLDADEAHLGDASSVIRGLIAEYPGCIVIAADLRGALLMANLAPGTAVSAFPRLDAPTLETLNNKWTFAETCRELDIPIPETVLFERKPEADFASLSSVLGSPFIVKPIGLLGGMGVIRIESEQQLKSEVIDNAEYPAATLIAQSFVEGADGGVSILSVGGVVRHCAVHVYEGDNVRYFQHSGAIACARKIADHFKLDGVVEFDVRFAPDGEKYAFLEANPRFWGSARAASWCGLDFAGASADIASGRASNEPAELTSGVFPGYLHTLRMMLKDRSVWTALNQKQRRALIARFTDPFVLSTGLIHLRRIILTQIFPFLHIHRARGDQ